MKKKRFLCSITLFLAAHKAQSMEGNFLAEQFAHATPDSINTAFAETIAFIPDIEANDLLPPIKPLEDYNSILKNNNGSFKAKKKYKRSQIDNITVLQNYTETWEKIFDKIAVQKNEKFIFIANKLIEHNRITSQKSLELLEHINESKRVNAELYMADLAIKKVQKKQLLYLHTLRTIDKLNQKIDSSENIDSIDLLANKKKKKENLKVLSNI